MFVERLGSLARVTCSGRPGASAAYRGHSHFGGVALEARYVWTHWLLLGGGRSQATPEPMGWVLHIPGCWVSLANLLPSLADALPQSPAQPGVSWLQGGNPLMTEDFL